MEDLNSEIKSKNKIISFIEDKIAVKKSMVEQISAEITDKTNNALYWQEEIKLLENINLILQTMRYSPNNLTMSNFVEGDFDINPKLSSVQKICNIKRRAHLKDRILSMVRMLDNVHFLYNSLLTNENTLDEINRNNMQCPFCLEYFNDIIKCIIHVDNCCWPKTKSSFNIDIPQTKQPKSGFNFDIPQTKPEEKQQNVELSYLKPNNNPMDMNMRDYVTPSYDRFRSHLSKNNVFIPKPTTAESEPIAESVPMQVADGFDQVDNGCDLMILERPNSQ